MINKVSNTSNIKFVIGGGLTKIKAYTIRNYNNKTTEEISRNRYYFL